MFKKKNNSRNEMGNNSEQVEASKSIKKQNKISRRKITTAVKVFSVVTILSTSSILGGFATNALMRDEATASFSMSSGGLGATVQVGDGTPNEIKLSSANYKHSTKDVKIWDEADTTRILNDLADKGEAYKAVKINIKSYGAGTYNLSLQSDLPKAQFTGPIMKNTSGFYKEVNSVEECNASIMTSENLLSKTADAKKTKNYTDVLYSNDDFTSYVCVAYRYDALIGAAGEHQSVTTVSGTDTITNDTLTDESTVENPVVKILGDSKEIKKLIDEQAPILINSKNSIVLTATNDSFTIQDPEKFEPRDAWPNLSGEDTPIWKPSE